ncbi:hypothetical protein TcCL_ESM08761 [Trypanosoma cruzi]|nr:hypothetical protein TcCL_ESM08761 [Trypanosoma cruzi]
MLFYWASNAECRPRRRKHSPLAAQRRPHRKSIVRWHGSSRGKQKKQRTGTSSSSSVITGSRRRVLLAVRHAASIPAAERRFSRSVGASWPDPLLLRRWTLLRNSRVYILRWCAAVGLNALRNGDGCPRGNPSSVDAGETVLLQTPSSRRPTEPLEVGYRWCQISCTPPRGHGK